MYCIHRQIIISLSVWRACDVRGEAGATKGQWKTEPKKSKIKNHHHEDARTDGRSGMIIIFYFLHEYYSCATRELRVGV